MKRKHQNLVANIFFRVICVKHNHFFSPFQQIITHIICSLWMVFTSSFTTFSMALTFCFCRPLSILCHRFLVTLVSPELSILGSEISTLAQVLHGTNKKKKQPWLASGNMWITSQHKCSQVVPGDAGLYGRTPQQMSILPWGLTFFWKNTHCLLRPVIWRCLSGWKEDLV